MLVTDDDLHSSCTLLRAGLGGNATMHVWGTVYRVHFVGSVDNQQKYI